MNWFKKRAIRKDAAARLYAEAVERSRDLVFYERLGVADTIDGRFDMLALQVFLVMDRLNALGPEGEKLSQALFDRMFRMIDLTLREMGIGDMGIPKHMKKMMKAFNGRAHAYHAALEAGDHDALLLAVTRNIYRSAGEAIPQGAQELSRYIAAVRAMLDSIPLEGFMNGALTFPCISTDPHKEAACAQAL